MVSCKKDFIFVTSPRVTRPARFICLDNVAITNFFVSLDTGTPPLTGSGTVRVVVQDVNDHSPEFELQAYSATVRENRPPGTPVLQPVATDKDADLNAKIR